MTRLEELKDCFQGVIPSLMATCGRDGEPNITYLSQVHYLDERRVALSCQFFNKTRRNVTENPHVMVEVNHPVTMQGWRLKLRFDHMETHGPLFDKMALRIQVIASHTGMTGVFRLISADVYEVLSVEPVEGFMLPDLPRDPAAAPPVLQGGPLTELRGLQVISERIARAEDLDGLLNGALLAVDEILGFAHSMVLVPEEPGERLVAIARRGYDERGIGAEVAFGKGLIGTVAQQRTLMRVSGMGAELRYGRAIRNRAQECGQLELQPEIPLPGLPDAQAQLVLPLLVGERLVGVLAVESRDPLGFDEWDEAFLQIVGNQIGMGIERMRTIEDEEPDVPCCEPPPGKAPAGRTRSFVYYRNDDCVFVDGEYLVRNVPGKILWKLLQARRGSGQCEFTNRQLRLDPALGLPPIKDNLESRLILLRKRLAEKCPDVRIVPVRRGRFALEADCSLELLERESG